MKLKFKDFIREESDENIINSLLRKGWNIIPNAPPHNPDVERAVYDATTNTYSVVELSDEEKNTINQQKILELKSQTFETLRNNGFLVSPENFYLALNDNDRNSFTQMLSLVKEALDLGLITNDTPQIISDKDGNLHTLTTLRFRQIMVEYGFYYKTIWNNFMS